MFFLQDPSLSILLLQATSGIFVHPSGVEKQLHDCLNSLRTCYGDKKGKQFRVWVDQVLPAQVGSDSWLVKFKKWEQSGELLFLFWLALYPRSQKSSPLFHN